MHIKFDEADGCVVCHLVGNLEHLTLTEFRDGIAQLTATKDVVFDLPGVPFLDSIGLGALINAVRRTRDQGGEAVICAPRPSLNRVLDVIGFSCIVSVFDTAADAQAHFVQPAVA
jgi:anti-anti-sigma factor